MSKITFIRINSNRLFFRGTFALNFLLALCLREERRFIRWTLFALAHYSSGKMAGANESPFVDEHVAILVGNDVVLHLVLDSLDPSIELIFLFVRIGKEVKLSCLGNFSGRICRATLDAALKWIWPPWLHF